MRPDQVSGLRWLPYLLLGALVLALGCYATGLTAPSQRATDGDAALSAAAVPSPTLAYAAEANDAPDRVLAPNDLARGGISVAALSQRNSSANPIRFSSKQIVDGEYLPQSRWTPTPVPSPTPLPSPTPVPTFVSDPSQSDLLSPLGLAPSGKWIDVSLERQYLVAYEGRTPVFETKVSTGTANHPTVTGQFRIWLRFASQDMDGRRLGYDYYLPDVPYVQYFYQDYALHGTYWHNNFGQPMSHGCVNLPTPAAEWLFHWADYGTLVNVHP